MNSQSTKESAPAPYVNRFHAWMWFAGMVGIVGIMIGGMQALRGEVAGVAVTAVVSVVACSAIRLFFRNLEKRDAATAEAVEANS